MRRLVTKAWPPARRRERERQDRLWDLRWEFWFHCVASRTLRDPEDDAWWTKYRALDTEIKALTNRGSEAATCPTCGPTKAERHPRRGQVLRCINCREWLVTTADESVRPDGPVQ